MSDRITQIDPAGLPSGVYQVTYYTVHGVRVRRLSEMDSGVSLHYVRSLRPAEDEVAVATCQSQPGGATVYGSQRARAGFDATLRRTE